MKTSAVICVGAAVLLMLWLTGCEQLPSVESLKAEIKTPYEIIYTEGLPRGVRGQTYRMDGGPAVVLIASDQNRWSQDGALQHELYYHVLHNVSHPPKPPQSNLAKPIGPGYWDRLYMGMPQ